MLPMINQANCDFYKVSKAEGLLIMLNRANRLGLTDTMIDIPLVLGTCWKMMINMVNVMNVATISSTLLRKDKRAMLITFAS